MMTPILSAAKNAAQRLQGRMQRGVQGVLTPALLIRVPFLLKKNSVNKYHRECIKTHHFDIRNTKIFWGKGTTP